MSHKHNKHNLNIIISPKNKGNDRFCISPSFGREILQSPLTIISHNRADSPFFLSSNNIISNQVRVSPQSCCFPSLKSSDKLNQYSEEKNNDSNLHEKSNQYSEEKNNDFIVAEEFFHCVLLLTTENSSSSFSPIKS